MNTLDRHFSGFISYNHQDSALPGQDWADWVQRTLETYKTPDELVGQTSIYGDPVPPAMPHIFRDTTQLPGTGDLDLMLREALSRSRVLIVLCSPAAARSPWVDQEVRTFKQLGRARQIIALILQGRPHSGEAASECYPPSLAFELAEDGTPDRSRLAHPVYIDLRAEDCPIGATTPDAYREILRGLGKLRDDYIEVAVHAYSSRLENARIMLLSGVLGLYTPELTQRERLRQIEEQKQRDLEMAARLALARRRTRMAMMTSALFVVLLAGAAFAAHKALRAENRALASEAAMEKISQEVFNNLVNWDTRVPLEKAEPVLRSMVDHYRNRPPGIHDHLRVAFNQSVLNRLGDILINDDEIEKNHEALTLFKEASNLGRKVLAVEPGDPSIAQNYFASLLRVATAHRQLAAKLSGNQQEAEYQNALAVHAEVRQFTEQQAAKPGASPASVALWRSGVADAYMQESITLDQRAEAQTGNLAARRRDLEQAIDLAEKAAASLDAALNGSHDAENAKHLDYWTKLKGNIQSSLTTLKGKLAP